MAWGANGDTIYLWPRLRFRREEDAEEFVEAVRQAYKDSSKEDDGVSSARNHILIFRGEAAGFDDTRNWGSRSLCSVVLLFLYFAFATALITVFFNYFILFYILG